MTYENKTEIIRTLQGTWIPDYECGGAITIMREMCIWTSAGGAVAGLPLHLLYLPAPVGRWQIGPLMPLLENRWLIDDIADDMLAIYVYYDRDNAYVSSSAISNYPGLTINFSRCNVTTPKPKRYTQNLMH